MKVNVKDEYNKEEIKFHKMLPDYIIEFKIDHLRDKDKSVKMLDRKDRLL